jgi:hypothetical protein
MPPTQPNIRSGQGQMRLRGQLRREALHRTAEDQVEDKAEAQKQKHEQAQERTGAISQQSTQEVEPRTQQPQNGELQPSPQVQQAVDAVDMTGEIHITMEEQAKGSSLQPGQVQSSIAQSIQSIEALGQSMGPQIEGM